MLRGIYSRIRLRLSCRLRGHQVSPFLLGYRPWRFGRLRITHVCVVCGKRLSAADVRTAEETERRRHELVIGRR